MRSKYKNKNQNILAKCPNTVWVLHHEKVILGVALSCYVVLGSRVVLCCVVLCCVVLCISKEYWESWRPYVAIPNFGVGLGRSGRWVL
mgnify:CR=1 FL=1